MAFGQFFVIGIHGGVCQMDIGFVIVAGFAQ
jgi:hypothetical protein